MLDIDKTIGAFRHRTLDFDCKQMQLVQRKKPGARFEGPGYVRQSTDGKLVLKIYVTQYDAKPFDDLDALRPGELYSDDALYDLNATGCDGTRWTATRILPNLDWDPSDSSVLIDARMDSITAHLWKPAQHYLRLHFFEEYELPLNRMSETNEGVNRVMVRDLAEFDACGSKFKVRKRDGSGDTIIEAVSESAFPAAFDLRIQEALQYITAKTTIWRARLASEGDEVQLEFASPRLKSPRTQFKPPILFGSPDFYRHGWSLFEKYLAYVVASTKTYWNPVAYHLNNACEATSGSLDAWAVGVSVAVEAVASLISIEGDKEEAALIARYQCRMRKWFADQLDLHGLTNRVLGQIDALSNKRADDALYALAKTGHVQENYIKAWRYLRNRHAHPTINDLKKLDFIDHQKLIDNILQVEVLLRQLTFYLIGYKGPFTDYGAHENGQFLTKQYPMMVT